MKRLIFAFIAIFSMTMEAQNITDAVRYSSTDLNGTARHRAMSGAFGALGGDLSSLNVNPAGSAVFLSSIASLTLNVENSQKTVGLMGDLNDYENTNVDLGQAGAAFVFSSNNENADWKKFSIAFNYNKSSNYRDRFTAIGRNPNNSIADYFLEYAQGVPLDFLIPQGNDGVGDNYASLGFADQQAYLGYEAFIFEAVDPNDLDNVDYVSNVGPGNHYQEYSHASTGLNGKFTFNFAAQYQDFLYLGLNLNSHFLNYERLTSTYEINSSEESTVNDIFFEDRLNTLGSGFSLQLGGIARIGNNLRAGLSYESPTWYTISEELTQYLETDRAIVEPNVINVYPDYKLQTPSKYTGSLAYLFGPSALISFDYSYKDYSSTQFKPNEGDYAFENDIISEDLQAAATYRLGGEYRIQGWSLRGGYRFEESPYADGTTIGDLQGYSFGLGYNFGNLRLDLAYDTYTQDRNPQLYLTGLTDRYNIERKNSNFVLSLSFGI